MLSGIFLRVLFSIAEDGLKKHRKTILLHAVWIPIMVNIKRHLIRSQAQDPAAIEQGRLTAAVLPVTFVPVLFARIAVVSVLEETLFPAADEGEDS